MASSVSVRTSTGNSGNSANVRRREDDVLALWAPTLLRHLGGTFTVKAFSLEDNELWIRHGLIVNLEYKPLDEGQKQIVDESVAAFCGISPKDELSYRCPFDKKLWEFIFDNLRKMSPKMENGVEEFVPEELKDVEYDEYLLLWHIATELCYNTEEDGSREKTATEERIFSKILSDYMLYLMVYQPGMMSMVSGMFVAYYEQARKIEEKSLVYRACKLAENLKGFPEGKRWTITSRASVEMLTYAARHCRGDMHIQSLSTGGELLTLVWLLMAHFRLIRYDKWRSHISHKITRNEVRRGDQQEEEQGALQICTRSD
ncbi:hypothetical protein CRG98_026406 [Punica granatum]|uniref:DUF4220 domain-containing protein n=1 Tax=Punica granatum TaxID=22663 RepID=A0A2I0JAA9_PUNGR|nr:hypothetical protein CRG98_026406 [Punica granatum]